jgi:hypothetical protein
MIDAFTAWRENTWLQEPMWVTLRVRPDAVLLASGGGDDQIHSRELQRSDAREMHKWPTAASRNGNGHIAEFGRPSRSVPEIAYRSTRVTIRTRTMDALGARG